jgi:phage/plasmid-associated DNA primase
MSAVKKFIEKGGYKINKRNNKGERPSHVFMDGGHTLKLYSGAIIVPREHIPKLHAAMAEDLAANKLYSLVETFPELYKFAIDYDFKTPILLDKQTKIAMCTLAQNAVSNFIGEPHCSIVSTVEGDERFDDATKLYKDGVHQTYTDLIVDHDQSRHLVTEVIQPVLRLVYPDYDWSSILDTSIYEDRKGLKGVFTIKQESCKPCVSLAVNKEPQNKDCEQCQGSIVIQKSDHFYVPIAALKGDATLDTVKTEKLKDDAEYAMAECSVIPCTDTVQLTKEFTCKRRAVEDATDNKPKKKSKLKKIELDEEKDSEQKPTFEEVQALYKAAGGTLELCERSDGGWDELSPGHDARPCLCPACKGTLHTTGAILRWIHGKLMYYCMSEGKHRHCLHESVSDEELMLGGELGLARLVARVCAKDVFNAGGDNDASYYVYDEVTALWTMRFASFMKCNVIQRIQPLIATRMAYYDAQIKKARGTLEGVTGEARDHIEKDIDELYQKRTKLYEVKMSLKGNTKLSAVLSLLKHEIRDEDFKSKLDIRKDILSTVEGVIELKTATLRPRVREDYCSFVITTKYRPNNPKMAKFIKLMEQITLAIDDEERPNIKQMSTEDKADRKLYMKYLQRLIGYAFTGENDLELFCMLLGSGSNGKSLIANWLCKCLQVYYLTASPLLIAKTKYGEQAGGTSSHVTAMKGKRVGCIEETPAELDETVIKRVSGGGEVSARELHTRQETFEQMCKLFALSNDLPIMKMTLAILRRLRGLPFSAKFYEVQSEPKTRYNPDDYTHFVRDYSLKNDPDLVECFFAWGVEGAKLYYSEGLGSTPVCCDVLRQTMEAANDQVGTFLTLCGDTSNEEGLWLGSACYYAFKDMLEDNGQLKMSKKDFILEMEGKGYTYFKNTIHNTPNHGSYLFKGVVPNSKD